MYGEDVDLGWRMRMAGFENVVVPESRVTHHYVFIAERPDVRRLRLIERNRWLVLISNYRIPTLCLLLPALLGLELVLWLGWNRKMFGSRLELWREIVRGLDAEFWRRRNHLQRTRRVGDRSILCHMTGVLQHGAMKESFGLKLANAVGGLYFSLLRACVWW
jgi:GT2 family glycosyltransferase